MEAKLAGNSRAEGLALLDEIRKIEAETPLSIVTLNHDTLIEKHFSDEVVCDGFVQFSVGSALFDPAQFDRKQDADVRLLKLHGSIDWFRYKGGNGTELALKIIGGDRDHLKDAEGNDLHVPTGRLLLAGTTNKELEYGSGVFLELMYQFHKRLKDTNLLIVSGYGFADKGINNRIWAWLDSKPENRIMILHANIEVLRLKAKPSFSFNMDRHKKTQKFAIVDRWMCDCGIEDLRREAKMQFG